MSSDCFAFPLTIFTGVNFLIRITSRTLQMRLVLFCENGFSTAKFEPVFLCENEMIMNINIVARILSKKAGC